VNALGFALAGEMNEDRGGRLNDSLRPTHWRRGFLS
jgi:hypothetical protein